MNTTVAILAGGGPAPGIDTVISSVAKVFLGKGFRVIGIHQGYKGLFSDRMEFVEMNFRLADRWFTQGGSSLEMSRYKPKDSDFSEEAFVRQNIKLLVTIGGDDTASTANRIAKFLQQKNIQIQNIHVPKTIDNDLPLPEGVPTFGYNSAKNEGVRIAKTLYEDARTRGNWFVTVAMGRSAGHLAFEIAAAAHYPMIIVPEMFDKTPITAQAIARLAVSSVLKRKIMGLNYGVIMISEGVFHFMTDEEIARTGASFSYDTHGHPELFNVSKAHVFSGHIQRSLAEIGLGVNTRPVEMGFELRCVQPIASDLHLCTLLGLGVYELFKANCTGCMVMVDATGQISPIYLKEVEDENGKIRPRLLNLYAQGVQAVINHNMHYITSDDYDAVAQYVSKPADYDFRRILNWE
ncbi:MAG: hypothetical protein RIS47_1278 [Bacteroidota bacterium]